MKFISLASSSDGNSSYISDGIISILIDIGINYNELSKRLNIFDIETSKINIIFVTHSHTDHIRGLKTFIDENPNVIVIGNKDTLIDTIKIIVPSGDKEEEDFYSKNFYLLPDKNNIDLYSILNKQQKNRFIVHPHKAYHDKRCTYYTIEINNESIAILTDCGHYDNRIIQSLKNVNYLMIESNYDPDLIDTSKYPDFLKRRIKGLNGHLSNEDAANIISTIYHKNLKKVCLAHISHNSNNEENALYNVKHLINKEIGDTSFDIFYARRDEPVLIV